MEKNKKKVISGFDNAINANKKQLVNWPVFAKYKNVNSTFYLFNWKKCFQLCKVPEGNALAIDTIGWHPLLFQVWTQQSEIMLLNCYRAERQFKRSFLPIIPLYKRALGVELLYKHVDGHTKEWTHYYDGDRFVNRYGFLGYRLNMGLDNNKFFNPPEQDIYEISGTSEKFAGEGDCFVELYKKYDSLDNDKKNVFIEGVEWYNKANLSSDGTDKLLYLVILLESFLDMKDSGSKCSLCGVAKDETTKKFTRYVEEVLGGGLDGHGRKSLSLIYDMRLRIVHSGRSIGWAYPGLYPSKFREEELLKEAMSLANQFLCNWLFHEVT